MTDFRTSLRNLRRPRLLIRAARFGLADYRRERDLRRLLSQPLPGPAAALPQLLDAERALEDCRRAGDAGYNLSRHVALLIALMGEARLLPEGPEA